jgi:hypothetical protein
LPWREHNQKKKMVQSKRVKGKSMKWKAININKLLRIKLSMKREVLII